MRSRKGNAGVFDDELGVSWVSTPTGATTVPVQITELEEGCPEDYIQPGEKVVTYGDKGVVLSQPFHESFRGDPTWVQVVRDDDGYLQTTPVDDIEPIPQTKTYTVSVEAESPEDAARKIVAEPQLLTES